MVHHLLLVAIRGWIIHHIVLFIEMLLLLLLCVGHVVVIALTHPS